MFRSVWSSLYCNAPLLAHKHIHCLSFHVKTATLSNFTECSRFVILIFVPAFCHSHPSNLVPAPHRDFSFHLMSLLWLPAKTPFRPLQPSSSSSSQWELPKPSFSNNCKPNFSWEVLIFPPSLFKAQSLMRQNWHTRLSVLPLRES